MSEVLRIVPLGGLGEVGKNMTVYETAGEILVVDAGLAFPRDEHFAFEAVEDDGSTHSIPYHRVRAVWRDGELIWSRPGAGGS